MNPVERWDDWEWEKAAHEIGKTYSDNSEFYEPERSRKKNSYKGKKRTNKDILRNWTGNQKRVALSAVLFLTILFSSSGNDIVSKAVYGAYKTGMESGNVYSSLNNMARDAIGLTPTDTLPVNNVVDRQFYPPVAGVVKVAFQGLGYDNQKSKGIEIQSSLGVAVLCPQEGVVMDVENSSLTGNTVHINFGDGWIGVLGNMGDISVKKGDPVSLGKKIGTVGMSAPRKQPWLYFQLNKDGKAVNPVLYLIQN